MSNTQTDRHTHTLCIYILDVYIYIYIDKDIERGIVRGEERERGGEGERERGKYIYIYISPENAMKQSMVSFKVTHRLLGVKSGYMVIRKLYIQVDIGFDFKSIFYIKIGQIFIDLLNIYGQNAK